MTSRLRKFLSLDSASRRLFLQAWLLLARARISLAGRPFGELVADLTLQREPPLQLPLDEESLATARGVGWAVRTAARHTPWNSSCLVQVLAARRLLQRQGIPGAFFLGAAGGGESAQTPGIEAHAWLRCGDEFITGEDGWRRFTVISAFSWD